MRDVDVVVVPSALALLPEYAGLADPVPELRSSCLAAVSWLVERHPQTVSIAAAGVRPDNAARGVRESGGERVVRHLLAVTGFQGVVEPSFDVETGALLVAANGSACRTEKAPGHLHPEASRFDEALGAALCDGDPAALAGLDAGMAEDVWCYDVPALHALGRVGPPALVRTDYSDDPYGVQYWVVRWKCAS